MSNTAIKEKLTPYQLEQLEDETEKRGKKKKTVYLLYYFFGDFGGHRYYVGDYLYGIAMTLTFGGFGVWTLIDLFFIEKYLKKVNKPIEDELLQGYATEIDETTEKGSFSDGKSMLKMANIMTAICAILYAILPIVYLFFILTLTGQISFFSKSQYFGDDLAILLLAYLFLKVLIIPFVLLVKSISTKLVREKQVAIISLHFGLAVLLLLINLTFLSRLLLASNFLIFSILLYSLYALIILLFITGVYRLKLYKKQIKLNIL